MRTTSFRTGAPTLAALLLALTVATEAGAQSRGSFGVGVVRNEAFAPNSQLYGAALTFGGQMALRFSGAVLPQRSEGIGGDTIAIRGWTADADLVLRLSEPRRRYRDEFSLHPYAFIGIGEMRMRDAFSDVTDRWNSWSYGGGIGIPVFSWLHVDGDARYRRAWDRDDPSLSARSFPRGWEYRIGIAVGN